MPRLGTESSSSSRRHSSNQSHSSHYQANSLGRRTTPSQGDIISLGESSSGHSSGAFDPPDDLLGRTRARASGSRTRWNARTSRSPYGHRPLSKWLSPEQNYPVDVVEVLPESCSDSDSEEDWPGYVAETNGEDEEVEGAEDDVLPQPEFTIDPSELGIRIHAPSPSERPHSDSASKKREKNKKKRAKARAKAKGKSTYTPNPALALLPKPPQDVLASMSRIAQLVGSLHSDPPEEESEELVGRMHDAFTIDGRTLTPRQWRAEVLRSVQRMENMLGRMEKWQADVAPNEIEAFRKETLRLEKHVRSVVEVNNRLHGKPPLDESAGEQGGKEEAALVEVEVAEVRVASSHDELTNGETLQAGANEWDSDDTNSVSDSAPESNSYPSDSDTRPTDPDLDDESPREEKVVESPLTALPQSTATIVGTPPPFTAKGEVAPVTSNPQGVASHGYLPPTTQAVGARSPTLSTLAPRNHNVPPTPPTDPVEYLKKHPWSMIEVLFLIEVVAHFPPAEHGWVFVTEVYNNLLITRPLQEWFSKQFASSNDEDAKMKIILQKMAVETRQLRARGSGTAGTPAAASETAAPKTKAGERGKAAPFGSAEARAQANAHVKSSAETAPGTPMSSTTAEMGAHFVTRLPYPIKGAVDDPSTPPPAQRILPFPRRRPPFNLLSGDAFALAQVMRTAASGVRGPSASNESRPVMYTLYAATGARFPVRTAWDCWHRWCTPWIVQDPPKEQVDGPPVVHDYVAGNLGLPCGTWITKARGFDYRPVPGTYPNVPGVQHVVTTTFDPRPGMVTFARMAHLTAERAWAAIGLRRDRDGKVSEEVLTSRRAKLPVTLAGIWPGKAVPKPRPPVATVSAPGSVHGSNGTAKTDGRSTASPTPAPTGDKSLSIKGRSASAPPTMAASSPSPPPQPETQLPWRPIPVPYKPTPRPAPHVPAGTLGHTVQPGIRAWFDYAALRADVLMRTEDLLAKQAAFMKAFTAPSSCSPSTSAGKDDKGEKDAKAERTSQWEEERDEERERGAWVPLHLRRLAVPPSPISPRRCLGSVGQAQSSQ